MKALVWTDRTAVRNAPRKRSDPIAPGRMEESLVVASYGGVRIVLSEDTIVGKSVHASSSPVQERSSDIPEREKSRTNNAVPLGWVPDLLCTAWCTAGEW